MSPDATADLRAPQRTIGRYRVLGVLGAGAMGEVLRARDERLGRDVAIKRIRAAQGGTTALATARFEAEARALAALTHPGVVQVFDLGVDRDEPYLVMELVDGPSLRDVLRARGPLPVAEVRAAGIQLARALEAAHARGVVHRDVKPANVLLAPGGVWKLADFGVAHAPDSSLTLNGQFLGTPAYAAPEALTLGQFGPASDVFGLAATLYEAATGTPPRGDASLTSLVMRSDEPALGPESPPPPPALAPSLLAALAIDPKARPSAAELADRLAATADGPANAAATVDGEARVAPSGSLPLATPSSPSVSLSSSPSVSPSLAARSSQSSVPAVAASSSVSLPPPPARPLPWRAIAAVAALVLVALIAIAASQGGGARRTRFAPTAPLSSSPSLPSPAFDPYGPPVEFAAPADLDDRGARDWGKIADRVHTGNYRDALHKLVELERKNGVSPESAALRGWLEDALAAGAGFGDDQRGD